MQRSVAVRWAFILALMTCIACGSWRPVFADDPYRTPADPPAPWLGDPDVPAGTGQKSGSGGYVPQRGVLIGGRVVGDGLDARSVLVMRLTVILKGVTRAYWLRF